MILLGVLPKGITQQMPFFSPEAKKTGRTVPYRRQ
jgi:hypothetical protein